MFLSLAYLAWLTSFELVLSFLAFACFSVLSTFSVWCVGFEQLLLYTLLFLTIWSCEKLFCGAFSWIAIGVCALLFDITHGPLFGLYTVSIVAYFVWLREFFYSIVSSHVSELYLVVLYVLFTFAACEICSWILWPIQYALMRFWIVY